MRISDYIDADLLDRFEFYNYNHAIEIITQAFPKEWSDVVECLRKLDITTDDLREAGGNETKIPKKFDDVLYPCGWREIRISGDLHIKFYPRQADQRGRFSSVPFEERVTENYIDGHNIDFLKGRIAFDLEWNSKDQTFDRDLLAMRTYYDCDIVSAGIIVTRSQELNDVFKTVYDFDKNSHSWKPIMRKYGASTTWMGKLAMAAALFWLLALRKIVSQIGRRVTWMSTLQETSENLLSFCGDKRYSTIYADPPWRFQNRTGKVAPENKKLTRYETMSLEDIMALPVEQVAAAKSHLYLWVPNALLPDGLAVMKAWGFEYKGNIIWEKVRKDGGPDGRGVGFYFRNVTEILLFGVKGDNFRTLAPARSQVNLIRTQKREHSRKPDEIIPIIESCSPGPFLELFARGNREGWDMWGNQATADYEPTWSTYSNHTVSEERKNV